MNINWRVRIKNPVFWAQIAGSVLLTALGYNQTEPAALTNWGAVWELLRGIVSNPYLLGLCLWSLWNAVNDPTTAGITDSTRAMGYDTPNNG